jgi:hypothetical protein
LKLNYLEACNLEEQLADDVKTEDLNSISRNTRKKRARWFEDELFE